MILDDTLKARLLTVDNGEEIKNSHVTNQPKPHAVITFFYILIATLPPSFDSSPNLTP